MIAHLEDERILKAIESLKRQRPLPDQVLVADGGSSDAMRRRVEAALDRPGWTWLSVPGTVSQSRQDALPHVRGKVTVIFDADQSTEDPGWLAALTAPILAGRADVTAGPCRSPPPTTRGERYVHDVYAWQVEVLVPDDVRNVIGANSAWDTTFLRNLGGWDPRVGHAGEDTDLALRAHAAGARYVFVPEAETLHDQTRRATFWALWRRFFVYGEGGGIAMAKHGVIKERHAYLKRVNKERPPPLRLRHHPYYWPLAIASVLGILKGARRWKRKGGYPVAEAAAPTRRGETRATEP